MGTPAEHLVGQLFKFHASSPKPHEVRIARPGKDKRIAEILTTEIQLGGGKLLISTLHDITDLVRLREELRGVAFIGETTGLFNHYAFIILAQQQLKIATRTRKWLFLMLNRVNIVIGTKNNTERHKMDETLIDATNILKQTFRNSDVISRISEDEFATLAVEAHYSSSHLITERLITNIEDYNSSVKNTFSLTLKLGTSFFDPEHPCSIDDLLARARATML
ncbi:GGDEF domain-containing protein [Chloroflexota bacterium]